MSTALRGQEMLPRPAAAVWWRAGTRTRLPSMLAVGLLAAIVYAAFAHGAVSRSDDTRLEIALAALAGIGAFGWLWLGTIRLNMARIGLAGVGLLAAFACWSGLSVLWSVAPDQTWIELNRVITYALVVCLGAALGTTLRRGVELIATGFVVVALMVTLYALGQKLFPGLHVAGLFNLDQTGPLARLQEPLGYWNALALFIALGAPAALALAVDGTRTPRARLTAAAILQLMLITIPFTYSRGGLVALAIALAVAVGLSAEWLRSLSWLALAVVSALPGILVGLLVHQLSGDNLTLGTREPAGGLLAALIAVTLVVQVLAGRALLRREPGLRALAQRLPRLRRLVPVATVAVVLAAVLALSLSPRGLTGTVSELWHGFTTTHVTSNYNPSRLLSAASENRWVWWKEAAGAFSDRPLLGWGAGSFPIVHLLYRQDTLPVQQPHSLPLQFLAETGSIGGVLGLAALALLALCGLRSVRRRLPGRERLLASALLAAAIAYLVHCLYDWDWNIPALSLPALLFLGVLAARSRSDETKQRRGSLPRPIWLASTTLWLCIFVLSVLVPQLAADDANAALVKGSTPSGAGVRQGREAAILASRLDPLSDQGLVAQATIALHLHQPGQAALYLRKAVARDPSDSQAWRLLAVVDGIRGDARGGRLAYQQALELDPMSRLARTITSGQVRAAPPQDSATRWPTPLP